MRHIVPTKRWLMLGFVCMFPLWLRCAAETQGIKVGKNVQVSGNSPSNTHYEVLASVDPEDPKAMMACSMSSPMDRRYVSSVVYNSFDGGRTWSEAVRHSPSGDDPTVGDPSCVYGPHGAAYFSALHDGRTFVYRSTDKGKSWSQSVSLPGAYDRPFLAVDQTGGKYNGRVYVSHTAAVRGLGSALSADQPKSLGGVGLWRSQDAGRTFIGPLTRVAPQEEVANPINSVVLSDGTLVSGVFVFKSTKALEKKEGSLKVLFSRDGGESYSDATKIADHARVSKPPFGKDTIPSLAVDPGSRLYKDRLYMVWTELIDERYQVMFACSKDKGMTWTAPQKITDANPSAASPAQWDELQATVSVNNKGVVGVMWYDGRDRPIDTGYSVRFTASLDGGDSWLPSIRVSEEPNTLGGAEKWQMQGFASARGGSPINIVVRQMTWLSAGHTAGLSADSDGVFHPFWIDNRTGVGQIWTAPIEVAGTVTEYGSRELSGLEDLSAKLRVDVVNIVFDRVTNTLTLKATLKNVSNETIVAPLKLKVVKLFSDLAASAEILPSGGTGGTGTILQLSDIVGPEGLPPDKESLPAELTFRLSKPGPMFHEGRTDFYRLLNLDVRIFGSLRAPTPTGRSH